MTTIVYPYSSATESFDSFLEAAARFAGCAKKLHLIVAVGYSFKNEELHRERMRKAESLFKTVEELKRLRPEPTNLTEQEGWMGYVFGTCWPQLSTRGDIILVNPKEVPAIDGWAVEPIHDLRRAERYISCVGAEPNDTQQPPSLAGSIFLTKEFFSKSRAIKGGINSTLPIHQLIAWEVRRIGKTITPEESTFELRATFEAKKKTAKNKAQKPKEDEDAESSQDKSAESDSDASEAKPTEEVAKPAPAKKATRKRATKKTAKKRAAKAKPDVQKESVSSESDAPAAASDSAENEAG